MTNIYHKVTEPQDSVIALLGSAVTSFKRNYWYHYQTTSVKNLVKT